LARFSLSETLRGLRGAKRLLLAALIGALSALAFPPFQVFPFLLLGYAALVLLLDGAVQGRRPLRDAALIGWCYGFGFHLVGLHWIGYAFLVNAEQHEWLLPFVAVLLPGGLALFFTLAATLYVRFWRPGAQRIFLFALLFGLVEWLRGNVFTGFPWNLPGYGWGAALEVLQSTALFGVYGLSLLTLLFGASLALLARDERRRVGWLPAAMVVFFILLWGQGAVRLAYASDAVLPNVRLRLVQTNLSQAEKYQPHIVRNWEALRALTAQPEAVPVTHIVWAEAAPPFPLTRDMARNPVLQQHVAEITGDRRILLTGDVRVGQEGGLPAYYNSFDMFGPGGRLLASSDKFHLVPFGEYVPLRGLLSGLGITEIAGAGEGFSSGPGPRTFVVPGAGTVTPLICYEVIFPGQVTGEPRPSWLVNMTDDSWFGPNAGPMQHFLIARVRAIEEGLPIARAANGGISAIIDPYGRTPARLPLGARAVLDGPLPLALAPTPFTIYGNAVLAILVLLFGGAALMPTRPLNR
jgi:apolipoprotein N-acyltransferase